MTSFKIESLQAGRAVACILVLFLHLGQNFENLLKVSPFHYWTIFGHIGVTYFSS
jgi:peptidoglycan/LPS O-acetylase OafA/YrhL